MSPKLGHMMGLSCSMLVLHGFWFGTSGWPALATSPKRGASPAFFLCFAPQTTLQTPNESQTWSHDGAELQHAGVAWVLVWDLWLASTSNFSKKRGRSRETGERSEAKFNVHFHFAPPCSTPMSPKLGHMMGLSCSMLVLHGFWFGTSGWPALATSPKRGASPAFFLCFAPQTTLQTPNESQTWSHDGAELQHAGVAWVLVWDLWLASTSNFSKKRGKPCIFSMFCATDHLADPQ
jgi:hypothetical protein